MKRQLIIALFGLSLGLIGQAVAAQPSAVLTNDSTQVLTQQFKVPSFNAIDISGPINVQLNAAQTGTSVQAVGDNYSLSRLYMAVQNGVLYLGLKPVQDPNVVTARNVGLLVKISVPQLNQMRYTGSGNIVGEHLNGAFTLASGGTGNVILLGNNIDLQDLRATGSAAINILGINSRQLNIDDRGAGKINLGGVMVLNNLNYQGSAPLNVEWINSTKVNVNGSGKGKITLAGIAGELDATLNDQVFMDAKYLHAEKGFINTRNQARADVWTKYNLSALATKGSTIYYYHDSQMVAGYMIAPGTVIRMTGIDTINR